MVGPAAGAGAKGAEWGNRSEATIIIGEGNMAIWEKGASRLLVLMRDQAHVNGYQRRREGKILLLAPSLRLGNLVFSRRESGALEGEGRPSPPKRGGFLSRLVPLLDSISVIADDDFLDVYSL